MSVSAGGREGKRASSKNSASGDAGSASAAVWSHLNPTVSKCIGGR